MAQQKERKVLNKGNKSLIPELRQTAVLDRNLMLDFLRQK